jgi:hypothetical protein
MADAASRDEPDSDLGVPNDLAVAAVAAVCTVGLTLSLRFGVRVDTPLLPRLAPLAPYFAYLFTRRLDLGRLDTARNWSLVTVAVSLAVFVRYAA